MLHGGSGRWEFTHLSSGDTSSRGRDEMGNPLRGVKGGKEGRSQNAPSKLQPPAATVAAEVYRRYFITSVYVIISIYIYDLRISYE